MPWNDPDEIRIAPSGQIYVAEIGTALPSTTTGALNAGFEGLGYATEDGVGLSVGQETQDIGAWQSADAVKVLKTARSIQSTFQLLQWNEITVPLAFGGGAISGTTPNFKYSPPAAGDGLDERSMVIETVDGDVHYRFVFPRVVAVDNVETNLNRTSAALLPLTVRILPPAVGDIFNFYTDDPAFATGS